LHALRGNRRRTGERGDPRERRRDRPPLPSPHDDQPPAPGGPDLSPALPRRFVSDPPPTRVSDGFYGTYGTYAPKRPLTSLQLSPCRNDGGRRMMADDGSPSTPSASRL